MAQRYSTDELYPEIYEDETGPLVKYEDYAALETKYENLLQIVRDSMRKIEIEVLDEDGN